MSFQWTIIAGFLYLEIGLVFIFLLPIVNPRKWQKIFNSSLIARVSKHSAVYFYMLLLLLFLFLIDALRDMRKYSHKNDTSNYASEMKGSIRMFRSQRNFYITFFSIFLAFVLRRVMIMIDIQATLINKSEAIIKEAEEAKDLACKTVKDHENLLIIENKNHQDVVKALNEEIDSLLVKCNEDEMKFKVLSKNLEEATDKLKVMEEKLVETVNVIPDPSHVDHQRL